MMSTQTLDPIEAKGYAHPEVLVSTQWVADHLDDRTIRIIESNEDTLLYNQGHIPGAVQIDWVGDLNDKVRRDYLDRVQFNSLMSKHGISNQSTLIFYGDKNNWWACYAFWVFQLFGYNNAAIMDGGRKKWMDEGRELSKDIPTYNPIDYKASERIDYKIRAFRDQVRDHISAGQPLVDVRSPKEYTGEMLHMEAYPQEGALRGGHIPVRKVCRGVKPPTKIVPSNRLMIYAPSMKPAKACIPTRMSFPTAGLVSAVATHGSSCTICWDTRTSAITMAHGQNGAI
jgi:thiosulfate/3-mercaptopyruvate sulfurtransferase